MVDADRVEYLTSLLVALLPDEALSVLIEEVGTLREGWIRPQQVMEGLFCGRVVGPEERGHVPETRLDADRFVNALGRFREERGRSIGSVAEELEARFLHGDVVPNSRKPLMG